MSPTRTASALVLALGLGAACVARAQQAPAPIEGVVVVIGDVDGDVAIAAAREAGGASWSIERLHAAPSQPRAAPDAAVEQLRASYLAADFLRCLTLVQEPALGLDALLSMQHRESAASVAVLGAACAWGAGDQGLAERLVSRAFAAELDVAAALAETTPDFQRAADEIRARIVLRERVDTTIETRPEGALAAADGGPLRCEPTPCTLALLPGAHRVEVSRLGFAPRAITTDIIEAGRLLLALDPAESTLVEEQLAAALAGGLAPGDAELARVAASAFEARVIVVVWEHEGEAHSLVYDRARDGVLARVAGRGAGAIATAVRGVIAEWRGITTPTPIYEEPLFWIISGAVAIAAGVLVYFLARPQERRYDLVFFTR